jgi:hypothetical protein
MIDWLRQDHENVFEGGSGQMTMSRGKVGMIMHYKAYPKGTTASAAPDNLFKIDQAYEKLKRRQG